MIVGWAYDPRLKREAGIVLRTTDAGSTWTSKAWLYSVKICRVSFQDSLFGSIVGAEGATYCTTNGGISWRRTSLATTEALWDICVTPGRFGGAVGDNGIILRTTNSGSSWTPQVRVARGALNSVSFVGSSTGIAAGEAKDDYGNPCGAILRTEDGGVSWKRLRTDFPLRSISMYRADGAVAVGDEGKIVRTSDGGRTWSLSRSPTISTLRAVSLAAGGSGAAVGDGGIIGRTTDGGVSWSRQSGTIRGSLYDLSFWDDKIGMAVGDGRDDQGNSLPEVFVTWDAGLTWSRKTLAGYSGPLRGISLLNGETAIAIGRFHVSGWGTESGVILRTTDGGTTWKGNWIDPMTPSAACVSDSGISLVVGTLYDEGRIWYSADSGKSWRILQVKTRSPLHAVSFGNGVGFAVGDGGVVLKTTGNGTEWSDRTGPVRGRVNGVAFADARIGIAVGEGQDCWGPPYSMVLRTTDGGASWINLGPWRGTTDGSRYPLCGVSLVDPKIGVAVGSGHADNLGKDVGVFLRTTDGGITWTSSVFPDRMFQAVHFRDANNGTLVGRGTDSLGDLSVILRTTDAGTTWTDQSVRSSGGQGLSSVAFGDGGSGIAVGRMVLRTTDGGATSWSQWGTAFDLHSVSFIDVNLGWAAGDGGTILRTTDGGELWASQSTGTMLPIQRVSFVDADVGVAIASGRDPHRDRDVWIVIRTTNAGASWTTSPIDSLHRLQDICLADRTTAVAIGTAYVPQEDREVGLLVRSTDSGATWNTVARDTISPLRALRFVDASSGWAVGDSGLIIHTSDGGQTWTRQMSGTFRGLNAVAFADVRHGLVAAGDSILRTTDGGATWRPQACLASGFGLRGLSLSTPEAATAVGGESHSSPMGHGGRWWTAALCRSSDGGATWTMSLSSSRNGMLEAVSFADDRTGTAVGPGGLILRTTTGGTTWTQDERPPVAALPAEMKLYQNYPNPFNPSTTIKFELPKTSHVSLTVYDILGREVSVLVNERRDAGVHEVRLDGSNLASGVYFYRLQTGDFTQTKRLLLLR